MHKPPVTVRLDPRRLEQLKAIAHAEGSTVTEVITQIIRTKVASGVIAATIPGVKVEKAVDGVLVTLGSGNPVTYSKAAVEKFVEAIRDVAIGGSSVINLDYKFSVIRQGAGIKISAPFPGPELSFPASLAEDLAGLIEEAAH